MSPIFSLLFQASDKLHNTTTELVINVMDENDNAPEFSQQSYQVALPEMTLAHVSVITVNATDRDGGENARLTYTMLGIEGFYIDSQRGTVRDVIYKISFQTAGYMDPMPAICIILDFAFIEGSS